MSDPARLAPAHAAVDEGKWGRHRPHFVLVGQHVFHGRTSVLRAATKPALPGNSTPVCAENQILQY